ncbi:MAG: hypothetical protein Fur0012_13620 [Elusimicrobiota bacterium]
MNKAISKKNLWQKPDYAEKYRENYSFPQKTLKKLLDKLKISRLDRVLEFGCGDGVFMAAAAKKAAWVHGIDCSSSQLTKAGLRLKGLGNVSLEKKNFLDFSGGEGFTRGFSRKALHHLSDRDKKSFFKKISPAFKPGSLFLIEDGIFFSFSRSMLKKKWSYLMKACEKYYGSEWEKKRKDVVYCFRHEYPTGLSQWRKALAAGGFRIERIEKYSPFYGFILARKDL